MKKKVLEAIHAMGIETQQIGEECYTFNYKKYCVVCDLSSPLPNYLMMCIPNIFPLTDENEELGLVIASNINLYVRIIKVYPFCGNLGMVYEKYVFDYEDLTVVIGEMLERLNEAYAIGRVITDDLMKKFEDEFKTE